MPCWLLSLKLESPKTFTANWPLMGFSITKFSEWFLNWPMIVLTLLIWSVCFYVLTTDNSSANRSGRLTLAYHCNCLNFPQTCVSSAAVIRLSVIPSVCNFFTSLDLPSYDLTFRLPSFNVVSSRPQNLKFSSRHFPIFFFFFNSSTAVISSWSPPKWKSSTWVIHKSSQLAFRIFHEEHRRLHLAHQKPTFLQSFFQLQVPSSRGVC